ncbi:TolC family protein [Hufsiella ginkgonis]|uniref:TolC family protein n=1 Tax=Hufsiella ginkgonis TaxID=2695274 RepID=A0A7K1Y1J7_9SPHI|nr:TolC family protein [Hufsiella ginkgonis]MXV17114.1 TolC family protein [Hufsiella ginkgonis]
MDSIFTLVKAGSFAKRLTAVTAVCALLSQTEIKAQEKITLQQAVEYTLKNNLQIKQAALGEALTEESLKLSKLALYPTLNASNNLNFSFGRSEDPTTRQFANTQITNLNSSVSSNVTLFQGFQKLNQIAQNKYQLEADKSYTNKIKNDLLLLVVSTYLQVLVNTDLLTAAQQQLGYSNQQMDRVQKLFDVGNNTTADLSQAKSQVATADLNVINAQNQLDISYLNLAQLMERDPAQRFQVVLPAVEVGAINTNLDPVQLFIRSAEIYPDIKLAGYNRLVAEKSVEIARGSYLPRLTLGGNLSSGYSDSRRRLNPVTNTLEDYPFINQYQDNFSQSIGLSLAIPIFNGSSARIGVRRAKINLQNAVIAEQLQKNNLNKTINQAVLDLRAAEKSYYSSQSAFSSSQDAFNATQQRYTVGLVNSLDFNQAQINLNTAQFNLIQAKYNLIFRNKVIDYYLGNPLTF